LLITYTKHLLTNRTIVLILIPVGRHIFHVDLDAFFVAVEQAEHPELRGKPVIVGGDADGRGVVATASYEARAFGVFSGQPLRTARRLAPEAIFVRGSYQKYETASQAFHAILRDFTPLVESGGLDEAWLDVTGCEGLIGAPPVAAASIRSRVRGELNLPCSVGIGSSKTIAKVASDKAKPDGIFEVAAGQEAAFLAPLPLRDLPFLGASMEKRLNQLGITRLGQVAALSVDSLEGLFGRHGRQLAARFRGIDFAPVAFEHDPQKSISREGTFAYDVADPAHLRAVLRGFSESVGSQLRGQKRRARTITLKLRYDDFTTISRSKTLKRATNSDEAIFGAAEGLMVEARERDSRPIRLIGVGAANLVSPEVQLALEPSSDEKFESISATFDRVRSRYGRRSLQTGRTAFDAATADGNILERGTGLSSQIR
jgi:DNA polymerase-4